MTSSYVDDKMGKMAYDAYMTQQGDITHPWEELPDEQKTAWVTAARSIEAFCMGQSGDPA